MNEFRPATNESFLFSDTVLLFFGSGGEACIGFCAPSPSSGAIRVVLKLSANYGTAVSSLPIEVSALP